jgi:hypothetical protein
MIVEGIVTTTNADGTVNVAPMGPLVDRPMSRLELRPFQTSSTFANLVRDGIGVFHVVDDVLLLSRAAIGRLEPAPRLLSVPGVDAPVLADVCRWYAFRAVRWDTSTPRARCEAEVYRSGCQREFFGFNRARHAVLEAAILATRVGILPDEQLLRELEHLRAPVSKTGGPEEFEAFELLSEHIKSSIEGRTRLE